MHKRIVFLVIAFCLIPFKCFSQETLKGNFGIIRVPVANLREEPAHKAELADQEIMGYTVQLLEKKEEWCKVKTESGYNGWMTARSFCEVNETQLKQWNECQKVRIVKVYATIYSKPDAKSLPVAGVAMNVLLKKIDTMLGGWLEVQTPDGRKGYLRSGDCIDSEKKTAAQDLSKSIISTAKMMMGAPYLWGGRSSVACDCSGFTSTVFMANGIRIGRDSRAQAIQGDEVKYNPDFSNVLPGDLIFFGQERVSHVAISLGGKDFIHQSTSVHITSFDPNSPYYEESYGKKLKAIRRFF
jgi:cell wall-associated NlpC family hydrolase